VKKIVACCVTMWVGGLATFGIPVLVAWYSIPVAYLWVAVALTILSASYIFYSVVQLASEKTE